MGKKILIFLSFLSASLIFSGTALAQNAAINFSPSSGTYIKGQSFSVNVYVNTPDAAMNAASGAVTFPADKLEVVSLSKSGSVMSLWVQEPSYSNTAGTVNFEGIVLNPGFIGNQGQIIQIVFKAKSTGSAFLNFSDGSVLANDGLGSNILGDLGKANFSLTINPEQAAPEATTPADNGNTPAAPKISSPTNPDSEKWYADTNPKFTWSVPADVVSEQMLYDRNFSSQPNVVYSPAISEKDLANIGDGIWYFHLRLRNSSGWGAISHFRFQIDTTKPDHFNITEIPRSDPTSPQASFTFDAGDKISGIDHYEIQIDDEAVAMWNGTGPYQTPVLEPGSHILIAKAVDKAGNFLANSAQFTINSLQAPTITSFPQQLTEGDSFVVKGTVAYPGATVRMFLQPSDNGETEYQDVTSDAQGNFTIIWGKKITSGVYRFWLQAIDQRGAKSGLTAVNTVSFSSLPISRFFKFIVSYLNVALWVIILIVGILAIIIFFWNRFVRWRRKLRKETSEIENLLRRSYKNLLDDIENRVAEIDGQPGLSENEKKIYDQLKKILRSSEKAVEKEVKDLKDLLGK